MNKWTTIITGLLTFGLAVAAFTLSFNNLTLLATEAGYAIPWLFPIIIEGAVIVFSVRMLWNSLNGENSTWQWACIIGASIAATLFNVYHSNTESVVAMIMAGLPSILLLLAFETFISQIKKITSRAGLVQSIADLKEQEVQRKTEIESFARQQEQEQAKLESHKQAVQAEIERISQEREQAQADFEKQKRTLEEELKKVKAEKKKPAGKSVKEKRQKKLAEIYKPEMTYAQLAETLKVHPNTVANDVKEMGLNGRG